MASQAQSESRAGRNRLPSRKAREAAENDNLEEPQVKKTAGKHKRKHTDIENEGSGEPQTPQNRRQSEFVFETLSSNRTSQRATNVINLQANRDGIPTLKTATPAKVVGGQRVMAAPPVSKNRLTKDAATHLAAIRHPYSTPSKASSSRSTPSGYGTSGLSMTTTPGPSRRSQPPVASGSSNVRPLAVQDQYNFNNAQHESQHEGTTHMHVGALPTPQGHLPSSIAPQTGVHRRTNPAPTEATRKGKERAHMIRETPDFTQYSVTESGRTWGVGQISTTRVDFRNPEASDVPSDDDNVYDDYDSHPRQAAHAQAYGITAPNPRAHEDLDAEELAEMAADAEADMDEEQDQPDQHVPPDSFEHSNIDPQLQPPLGPARHRAALDSQREGAQFHEHANKPRDKHQLVATHGGGCAPAEAEQRVRRRAQRSTEPSRKKPRASDYDPEAKQVLARAITVYKARLTLEDAYPDNMQGRTWAKQAWEHAAEDFEVPDLEPDADAIPLMTRYSWHLRGEIKTAARAAVQGTYGFKSVTFKNPLVIAHNKNIATMLLHERVYKYEDPGRQEGLYEGDIIQAIINRVYYKDAEDDGVVHDDAYRPFPFAGVALVLTAIECALNEWSTGLWQNVQFDEKYKAIYKSHLIDITRFHAASGDDNVMKEICTTISENGRFNAKVPVFAPVEVVGTLSDEQAARAIAEYRRRQEERRRQANL